MLVQANWTGCRYSDVKRKAWRQPFIMVFLPTLTVLILLLSGIYAETQVSNKTQPANYLHDIEVPDKILLLLRFKTNSSLALARQTTDQNISTTQNESSTANRRCSCADGVCKCCTGYVMDLLNQKACMRVTYHPGDFAFDVAMSLNNRVLYENSMSGKNPRPICISPPRINNLKVCAKFYNVFFPGRNFHFCLAMEGKWRQFELFNFAFDCLRMGANGIAMVGPDEGGGLPIPNPQGGVDAVVDSGEEDIEDYDENVVRSLLGDLFDDDDDDDDDDDR